MKHTAQMTLVGTVSRAPYMLSSAKGETLDASAVEITVDGNKPMTYRVEAWKDKEGMLRGLRKGMEVRVEGYLNSRSYNDALYYNLRAAAVFTAWEGKQPPEHGQNDSQQPQNAPQSYQRGGSSYGYGNRQQGGYGQRLDMAEEDIPF